MRAKSLSNKVSRGQCFQRWNWQNGNTMGYDLETLPTCIPTGHRFAILAGEKTNPTTNVVKLTCSVLIFYYVTTICAV